MRRVFGRKNISGTELVTWAVEPGESITANHFFKNTKNFKLFTVEIWESDVLYLVLLGKRRVEKKPLQSGIIWIVKEKLLK